jgi:hypothetical protein
MLPLTNRDVIRDSAVQLGLSHQRGAIGVLIHQLVPVPVVVMNVCGPVTVKHSASVCACVRACVRECVLTTGKRAVYSGLQCMLSIVSFLLSVRWVPAQPLVVGWLALRLSACEIGSAGAGLHFVMRSERMAGAMREMGFEGDWRGSSIGNCCPCLVEAANRVTINCWYPRWCGAVGVYLGGVVVSARARARCPLEGLYRIGK